MPGKGTALKGVAAISALAFLLGCASLAAEEPSGPAAARALLSPPNSSADHHSMRRAVTGNTLAGQGPGGTYFIFLAEDGSAFRRNRVEEVAGRWRIDSSGKVCARFVSADQESCYAAAVDGSSDYVLRGERPGERVRIVAGNPQRL
jgi:hypothetical protein